MKKQKKQMVLLLILLVVVLAAYFGIQKYSQWNKEREKQNEEAAEIHITEFSVDEAEKFSYTYQSVKFAFTKQEDSWVYDDDETLDIDEDSLEDMILDAVQLDASEEVKNVTDLSQYGLDEAETVVTFTISGKEYALYVGDYNDILSKYYAYLSEDPTTVYLISSSFKTGFNTTVEELVVVEEETETESETEVELEPETEAETEPGAESEESTEQETESTVE